MPAGHIGLRPAFRAQFKLSGLGVANPGVPESLAI